MTEQLRQHCDSARLCPSCKEPRNVKDYRKRRVDTVLGSLVVSAPRFDSCRSCGDERVVSPISQLLPRRLSRCTLIADSGPIFVNSWSAPFR